jgi:hypothetical protein
MFQVAVKAATGRNMVASSKLGAETEKMSDKTVSINPLEIV